MKEKDRSQTSNKKQFLVVGLCLLLIVLVILSVHQHQAASFEFRILAGLKRQAHLHLQVRQKRNI